MTATYNLSKSELTIDFLNLLKNTFKSESISITVKESNSKKNSKIIEFENEIIRRSKEVENNTNTIIFEATEFNHKFNL